jgi:hypothetical protein
MVYLGSYISGGSALSFANSASRGAYTAYDKASRMASPPRQWRPRAPNPTRIRARALAQRLEKRFAARRRAADLAAAEAAYAAATITTTKAAATVAWPRWCQNVPLVARPRWGRHMAQLAAEAAARQPIIHRPRRAARTGARDARATRKA